MTTRHAAPGPVPHRQAGFSLIELMVALVLGLVVIGGVINIFLTNQQASRSNEDLSRMQESARLSFELMAREVRQVGGNACGAQVTANVLKNAATSWWANWDAGALEGFAAGVEATDIVPIGTGVRQRTNDSDALKVLSGGMFNGVPIQGHDAATGVVTLPTTDHGFAAGNYVVICDAESAAIAQVTAASTAGIGSITHAEGGEVAAVANVSPARPGNCAIGINFPAPCAAPNSRSFAAGGYVTRYSANTWFVGNNERGRRSLFRVGPDDIVPVEVVEGVVNMTIDYLTFNGTTMANNWVNAAAITDWSPAAVNEVVAVRLRLDLESVNNTGTDQAPLRRQLIHVVNLRNRSTL
ncbi:prepilin-type N-terminal cleavage/methylation domain-containing protein [Hydrogenophaga sp.]|uniref:prepilin-type N-terminal cleavage/methylation domain-containing protein n=1 Tax=Hydrogenophaga sp. TaxID=1904254 RepID=UPI002ABA4DD2|nr:prepilin-type N-terminal cleavage/methylation domain-containing protein [Hydrogenophaga sp.]MDZ4398522.1 prepilin-type N-terminal cleavage/methylation domain-containing protein [Hydrogenophaga sp.]